MNILKPVKIADMELKNRMVMAPMGAEMGDFDHRSNAYYLRRAQGGASMVMVNVLATRAIDGPTPSAVLTEESYEGFRALVDGVHEEDCKLCIQIMPGTGLGSMAPGRTAPAGVSAVPLYPGSEVFFEELTQDEIHFIQDEVSRTLLLAKKAGADAVEIHSYGGYLTDRFLTKRWNIRKDQYGGSLENRMRFLNELIHRTKSELGDRFPLIVKFTPSHYLPEEEGYRGFDEGLEIARILQEKGVHALHVDAGCHDNWYMAMPPIYQQEMAPQMKSSIKVKEVTDIPVISNGRLGDAGKAEAAIANGWVDIAAIGRGLLADPDFPKKVAAHRTDEIFYCISCNEGCIKSVSEGRQIDCAVNPLTGWETEKQIVPARKPLRVLVIGAGPGGCQGAISSALSGHDVEIWEKNERLGGNFLAACMPPFKRDGMRILDTYRTVLKQLGVRISYLMEGTEENILEYNPDKVIFAAGGSPVKPSSIPGIAQKHVASAVDVLRNQAVVGESAAIIGGGLVGCETAVTLAMSGKKVAMIEMAETILPEPVFIQNKTMLLQLLSHPNITVRANTRLESISEASITVTSDGVSDQIPCDTVVLAMGFRPNDSLYNSLSGKIDIVNVGDSVKARKVMDAVREAHDAVLAMGRE